MTPRLEVTGSSGLSPRRIFLHLGIVAGLIAVACSSHKPRTMEDVALESSGRFAVVLGEVIGDPGRSARAGEIFAVYREQQQRFAADMGALKAESLDLYGNYESTDEEFEAMAARLRGRREAFRDEIASGLAELIEVLEPEEWTETINLMLDEEDRWRELGR